MPRILLNTWRRTGRTFGPALRDMYGAEVQYVHALQLAGAAVFLAPQATRPGGPLGSTAQGAAAQDTAAGFDGLVLIGGEDLAAGISGADPDLIGENSCESRDRWDISLLRAALRADLPVLAICRGLQLLNAAFGGTLHGDIAGSGPDHPPVPDDRTSALEFRHRVSIDPTSLLGPVLGPRAQVNSLHHQSIATLGDGLAVTARADDGGIEAVEYPAVRWCVGVQWHPELMPGEPGPQRLFDAFVAAASQARTASQGKDPR